MDGELLVDAPSGSQLDAPDETVGGDYEELVEPAGPEDAPWLEQAWLLKQGVSVISVPERQESPEKWVTEKYAVRQGIVNDIKMRLKVQPQVDGFAEESNHRFEEWWGPGSRSEVEDAFKTSWAGGRLLWLNPPFSVLDQVVKKVRDDAAKVVLICPDWRTRWFWKALQKHVVRRHYYPAGTWVFELPAKTVPAVKWGVWAYYLDGAVDNGADEELFEAGREYAGAELDGTMQNTKSRRRRKRARGPKKEARESEESS